jgi:hypothetical protein
MELGRKKYTRVSFGAFLLIGDDNEGLSDGSCNDPMSASLPYVCMSLGDAPFASIVDRMPDPF